MHTDKIPVSTIDGIQMVEELDLYLVENGLKPAALITLDTAQFDEGFGISRVGDKREIITDDDLELSDSTITQFDNYLTRRGFVYQTLGRGSKPITNERGKKLSADYSHLAVARNQEDLEKLVLAYNNINQDEASVGDALGFPRDATEAFNKEIDGEKRNGDYCTISLAKAIQAGIKLPTWLAYMGHVPGQLDLVNDDVSASSREQSERYQAFVREHNPDLARRVEEHFASKKPPTSLRKDPEHGMILTYR